MRSTRCGWRGTVKVTKGEGLFPKQKDRGQKDRGGGRCPGRKPKFRATDKAKSKHVWRAHSRGQLGPAALPTETAFSPEDTKQAEFLAGGEINKDNLVRSFF